MIKLVSRLDTVIISREGYDYGRDIYEPLVHAVHECWYSYVVVPQGERRHVANPIVTEWLARRRWRRP